VPSVILNRARPTVAAENDNESWESNTTNTSSSKLSSTVDLTVLSDSIKSLGEKAESVAALQAKELRQNRIHDTLEKKKDRSHAQQQSRISQKMQIGDRIAKLKAEKRKLQQDFFLRGQSDEPAKKKKELSDFYKEQIKQVEEEIAQEENEVSSILETPTRSNRTPDSAV
jgi:hypothetical protein